MYIYQPDRVLLEKQIAKYADYIKGVVLDVGAGGSKRYASYFKYDKYLTLDVDPGNKPDILAPAEKIPLGDNSVNAIVCTQVLGDVTSPAAVLKEFHRVLKPGGAVLLTESLFNEMHDEPNDFWRFTRFGLERLFSEAGFKVVGIDQRGGFFSMTAQNNIRYLIDKFSLYSYKWARAFNPLFRAYSRLMFFMDKLDKTKANRKFTIGWCALAQKQ